MSGYRVGAFEALEWAWHMLRSYRDKPNGVDEARHAILQILGNMGRGDGIDFREEVSKASIHRAASDIFFKGVHPTTFHLQDV